jgi:hypothetical protein
VSVIAAKARAVVVERLVFVLTHYRGDVFEAWLDRLYERGFAHGSELVEALGAAGMTDNVRAAEELLVVALGVGWIERGRFDPSRDQRFFGAAGRLDVAPDHLPAYHYAPAHMGQIGIRVRS